MVSGQIKGVNTDEKMLHIVILRPKFAVKDKRNRAALTKRGSEAHMASGKEGVSRVFKSFSKKCLHSYLKYFTNLRKKQ